MDAHHNHGHEVAKNAGAEALTLVLQRELELEHMMEEAKAEAERIVEAAKKEAQEIKSKREEASRQTAKQNVSASQQQKSGSAASMAADNLPMTEEEKKQIQRLKETAEQNIGKVVELVLKEVIP